ncbi:LysR family transcriptional regulator [Pseudomonas sp. JV551A1]|uniref:LysR family transcriptional regulator n=1 Tax=Pseudomonas sp. JV551A1 TaxID=2078787 RepID=UPI003555F758
MVHCGSRDTFCTPQAAGKQVRELERYLGARLLECTTRTQVLTPSDRDFYPRASSILLKIEEAERLAGDFRELSLDIE